MKPKSKKPKKIVVSAVAMMVAQVTDEPIPTGEYAKLLARLKAKKVKRGPDEKESENDTGIDEDGNDSPCKPSE